MRLIQEEVQNHNSKIKVLERQNAFLIMTNIENKSSTFQSRFRRVCYPYSRFREYIKNQGTKREKAKIIASHVWNQFYLALKDGKIIQDRTLLKWSLSKSRELNFGFNDLKASNSLNQ